MRIPKWSKRDLANPDYDLCKMVGGIYFDVVRHVNGTWSVFIAGKRMASRLLSRQASISFIESKASMTVSELVAAEEIK